MTGSSTTKRKIWQVTFIHFRHHAKLHVNYKYYLHIDSHRVQDNNYKGTFINSYLQRIGNWNEMFSWSEINYISRHASVE